MKKVFIIHGWGGDAEEGCFPWLKQELKNRGFVVYSPAMPEPFNPKIDAWVSFLKEQVGEATGEVFLVGHSIGTQTILRYLESLGEKEKIGGAILLAPWVNLTDEAYEDKNDVEIAKPWLNTPIDWEKVKTHTDNFIAIFSDNDPLVPLSDSEIFKEKLGAKIIIENDQGHFSGSDGIKELPSLLNAVLEMAR